MAKITSPKKAAGRIDSPSTKRKNRVTKRHRGVHPPDVARPKLPVPISEDNSESSYWGLTDESSYAEYAWAFLRRNRYYQHLCDKRQPKIPLSIWGYRSSPDREWGYGLTRLKHYSTAYADGTPQWDGIHPFVQQLGLLRVQQRARPGAGLSVDHPNDQVAIVFDLGPLLGRGTTVIDIQLELARAHLHALTLAYSPDEVGEADRESGVRPRGVTRPTKKLLRAHLRVADLLSSPERLAIAKEPDPESSAAKRIATALRNLSQNYSPTSPVPLKTSDIVDLIPTYDLKRTSQNKQSLPSKDQRLNRASELAGGAWENIYKWRMLGWLQFDDWSSFSRECANAAFGIGGQASKATTARARHAKPADPHK
jgi:hypothetical protein